MSDKQQQPITPTMRNNFPVLPSTVRNDDTLQWFYNMVLESFSGAPLYLRRSNTNLYIRHNNQWRAYGKRDSLIFWRDAMSQHEELRLSNWSTKRMQQVWDYVQAYASEATFDNRRYFETSNMVLDAVTGELHQGDTRFLDYPTTRCSVYPYDQDYTPSPAWQQWYDTLDPHQQQVRDWSVASAVTGEYGLLFTFGQSRTGKSTLAEGLSSVLDTGARIFSLSNDFGRFTTRFMENTTYLYDPDAKGSKNHNNNNYETLHLMASGDPIKVEIKGGDVYQTTNYGFVEVVSNAPVGINFEQSLVDRVRFCLYTYIRPRADGGTLKRMILADKQAWLNYAIECAMKLAKGDIQRPPIDRYQAYGWVQWLKGTSSYGRLCVKEMRLVSYSEYENLEGNRYRSSKETVEDIQAGIKEISRQLGEELLMVDWEQYGKELEQSYYNEDEDEKASKLF